MAPLPWKLACFDLDGTLVPDTTTCLHLADHVGHRAVVEQMEDDLARGHLATNEFARRDASHYAGLSRGALEHHLESLPLIAGIADTVQMLRAHGIHCLLCTVTWQFAALTVAERFGFAGCSGAQLHQRRDGRFSGEVARHFNEHDKRSFVANYCAEHGIDRTQIFAVGDGQSDVPMFGFSGFSVAMNATPAAQAAASVSVSCMNLREIFDVVPGLVEHGGTWGK